MVDNKIGLRYYTIIMNKTELKMQSTVQAAQFENAVLAKIAKFDFKQAEFFDGTLFVEGVSETSGHAASLPSFPNEYPMLLPMMLNYKLVKQKGLAMLSHCHQIRVLRIM